MSAERVLVTGGAGLIGSHIVDLLLDNGYAVRVFDNLDAQTHPNGAPEWIPVEAEFLRGDMRSLDDLEHALEGVDTVVHQAAFGGFTTELSLYADVNASGTVRLFEAIRNTGRRVRKVVVASSQAAYGEGTYLCARHGVQFPPMRTVEQLDRRDWEPKCPECDQDLAPVPTPEDRPLNGETVYGLTKLAEERWALALGKSLGVAVSALRYAVTFGPRQSIFNPYTGVVSIFSTRLLNGLPIVVYEDGNQTRDYIFVTDVARANLKVLEDPRADGQVFNVGTGRRVSVLELVQALSTLYERQADIEISGAYRPQDVRHIQHDARKLEALGWKAHTQLSDGLQHYGAWIANLGPVHDYFTSAYERLAKLNVVRAARG
jgi:dTDP-L-rhamnose 4-epimerase